MLRRRACAFTLIELLVVISIIVVLLALLTPALDKALYQAELAVCAANQKGMANAVNTYAASNKSWYPDRPTKGFNREAYLLAGPGLDDRLQIRDYMPLNKVLNDPLTETIDYENTDSDSWVFMPYSFWFGFGYTGHEGLTKLGKKLSWTDSDLDQPTTRRFDVLITDHDVSTINEGLSQLAHPDADGRLTQYVIQDKPVAPPSDNSKWVFSIWRGPARTAGDVNAAFTDGSVHRYDKILWNEWQQDDARMARVPIFRNVGAWPEYFHQLPIH